MPLNVLPVQPSYPVQTKNAPLVRVASFGNNYKMRCPAGFNSNFKSWNVVFNLKKNDRDTLDSFFESQGAHTPFTWNWPTGESFQVVCVSWDESYNSYGDYTITAIFEEDFTWVS